MPSSVKQSDQDFADLLACVPTAAADGLIVIDEQGRVVLFNPMAEAIFGYSTAEIVDRKVSLLMPAPYQAEHAGYLRNYLRTGQKKIIGIGRQVTARSKDGTQFPIDLSVGEAKLAKRTLFVGVVRDLRRRASLESMLDAEHRYASKIFELIDEVIVGIDAHGIIQFANRMLTQSFNKEQSPIGAAWFDNYVHPNDRNRVAATYAEMFKQGSNLIQHNEYALDINGQKRLFSWQHQLLPPSSRQASLLVLSTGSDITDQQHLRRLVRDRSERLRLIFDQSLMGEVLLNMDRVITEANHTFCTMLGLSPSQLVGRLISELLDDDSQIKYLEKQQLLLADHGLPMEFELNFRDQDNTYYTEVSMGNIRNEGGVSIGILLQVHDISNRRMAEAEISELKNHLAHVNRVSLMGELAASIAHELNQPLTAIANYAEGSSHLLGHTQLDRDKLLFACTQIRQQASRAGDVLDKLRALIKREPERRLHKDIKQLIIDILKLLTPEINSLDVPIKLELQTDLPKPQVDPVQIQQVILNLVLNALEAIGKKSQAQAGLKITSTLNNAGQIEVCIEDHGNGISADQAKNIFDPFVTSKQDGMGMGLSICATIIRAHAGNIWYQPNPGGGSRFLFTLPITQDEIPPAQALLSADEAKP